MAWYDEATFYHIYPLGLCGCPHENNGESGNCFGKLNEWAEHVKELNCTAIYIGPLFESVGHGYETSDYRMVDRRLGTNEDFKNFVKHCHDIGLKVIVDGVFNHTGREFFAFKDIKQNRENSRYKDWYLDVNFWGNNEYNDGFSYQNWGGYNLLVKLNLYNPEVKNYHFDTVRFWVSEFDIDGIRLDAADVLDHNFMRELRAVTNSLKPDFWLMGEVIHGDYSRWANGDMLHSVTNYELHKGLFSGLNDHNFFEIAHSIQRLLGICGNTKLYTFVDNHDVARIYSKLNNKEHLFDVHLLLYTVPGIPSLYYGSEFAIEGSKQRDSDWNLRPDLNLADFKNDMQNNDITKLIVKLGEIRKKYKELAYGEYKQLLLTNRQFAFARILDGKAIVTALNNDDAPAHLEIPMPVGANKAVDLLQSSGLVGGGVTPCADLSDECKATIYQSEQTKAFSDTISGLLHSIHDKLSTRVDCDFEIGELKGALQKLNDYSGDLFAKYDNFKASEANKKDSEQKNNNAEPEVLVPVEMRDGKIILDLPANRGTIVYLSNG